MGIPAFLHLYIVLRIPSPVMLQTVYVFSFVSVGVQIVRLPTICKSPFDLYQIFNSVQHHGGFLRVSIEDITTSIYSGIITTSVGVGVCDLYSVYKCCSSFLFSIDTNIAIAIPSCKTHTAYNDKE